MSVITIASNPVTCQLIGATKEAKLIVSELLAHPTDGGDWSGVATFFQWGYATFPTGFLRPVYAALKKAGHKVIIARDKAPPPLGPPVRDCVVDKFPANPDYDFQYRPAELLAKHRQVIIQVATGGGKSRIAKLTYAHINRPTLFLTTRKVLMHQMRDAVVKDMGIPVGIIGEGKIDAISGFNVGMVQTLAQAIEKWSELGHLEQVLDNRAAKEKRKVDAYVKSKEAKALSAYARMQEVKKIRNKYIAERKTDAVLTAESKEKVKHHNQRREAVLRLLSKFEMVIMEEAHEASGNSYFKVMNACVNATYRMALTATPFMNDDMVANYRLMATSGEISLRVTEKELIDKGILATPYFQYLDSDCPKLLTRSLSYARAYRVGIVENANRNAHIVAQAARACDYGLGVLILINHTDHGEILLQMLDKIRPDTPKSFISGRDSKERRESALKILAGGGIAIGSTILDVGVDVPSVGFLILGGGGKAETALRQRIGRVLRAKPRGPNISYIVDFNDKHNNHLREHALMRREIVKNTEGFGENILTEDFDFTVFE